MVDAGQAFQVQAALERARLLQQFDIGWLEEPLSQDDFRGYARALRRFAGSNCRGRRRSDSLGLRRFDRVRTPCLAARRGDLRRPDGREAGFGAGTRLATKMRSALLQHWNQPGRFVTLDGGFGPENALVEYCLRPSPLMRQLVRNLPPLVDGYVPVPQGPGLGIELDQSIIEQFRVS